MDLIKQILENLGYTVRAAMGRAEAIKMTQEYSGEIHLLMTDVVMQEMNGKDLAREIIKIRSDAKVLFMSGYTSNAIVHHGKVERGLSFIQKPFTPESLARKIRKLMDKNRRG